MPTRSWWRYSGSASRATPGAFAAICASAAPHSLTNASPIATPGAIVGRDHFVGAAITAESWGGRWDSNPQQQGSQPWTLPLSYGHHCNCADSLACPTRLELVTPSLEGWCSIRLSYGQSASKQQKTRAKKSKFWSGREDLNLRHLAPKASALPDCATPRKIGGK